ncbi:MAG: 50S ribosomal protein L6 [Rhodospirillaceae bacterium]|nr:50S ribosomal protein L6 [Rhodospirillaceae bacterium]
MSRIGKNPVAIPDGVDVAVSGREVTVKGKLGELNSQLSPELEISTKDGKVFIKPIREDSGGRSMWGLGRTIVNNMILGVSQGFSRKLEIVGVGYRAAVEKKILTLQLGYSHDIKVMIPDEIEVICEKPTEIEIKGVDKQQVGQLASDIRDLRKPEPYKGKGVRYVGEYILRKEGKKK